jgi:photosystem II stability/assembly factor-like uncharacterized protein
VSSFFVYYICIKYPVLAAVSKIWIFFVFCLLYGSCYPQGTWTKVDVPTHGFMRSLFFADSLHGWIAGDSGTIIHTSDAGKTWIIQNTGTTNEISSLFFTDRNHGWASSLNYQTPPYGTLLLRTDNAGADWISVPYPEEDVFITCILFRDSLNGWMGARPNAILKTTDGGAHWTHSKIDTSVLAFFPVLDIKFYNEKYGYACGGLHDIAGVIWRTSNGGDNWDAISPSDAPADEVQALHLFDSLNVIGAGGDPDFGFGAGMIRTSDGGINWNYVPIDMQGVAYDIGFRNTSEVWCPMGSNGTMIYSNDQGNTWKEIENPDSAATFRITFPDSLHGWACGKDGAVLKYKPASPGGINPAQGMDLSGIKLYQNSPDPFTSMTTIRFTIPETLRPVTLTLKVYSIFGSEVATLEDGIFPPGKYETIFKPSNLHAGVYFYRLSGNSGSLVRKMVVD